MNCVTCAPVRDATRRSSWIGLICDAPGTSFRRENRVISLLYELDWKNRDVAWELGVNESRVSQIKHVALSKLRAGLAGAR